MSPSGTVAQPLEHTFLAPAFERAIVSDAMRLGVVSCPGETPLREAARIMAAYRIHSVVVDDLEGARPWGIVADLDIVAAAGDGFDERTVRQIACTELVTVSADESLARASQLMAEHQVAHLLVVQRDSGQPVGVLSTLDVAGVLAWGETPA